MSRIRRPLFKAEEKDYIVNDIIQVREIDTGATVFGLVCNKESVFNYFRYNPRDENRLKVDYVYK